jgi:Ser/Thr protein kinase RdoA (MazF antagonist)
MDQLIKNRYNDAILQEAMLRFGIPKEQIQFLDAVENFIYGYERDSKPYILRIAHNFRRSEALVQGEVDWINYLAVGGVTVSRAILSEAGKLVETIDDGHGGAFLATAFVKAPGQAPWDLWTPELYRTYGQMLGRIHTLSKNYQPKQAEWKRPAWDDAIFEFVEQYLPESEALAKMKYREVCEVVNLLAKDADSYGLTHQDAHGNNFFVDEAGRITLFDFDECAYNWFVNDIAIALFYIVQDAQDWSTFTGEFLTHFLRGYVQACPLDPAWLTQIPAFLKIREIELYATMHRDFDVTNVSDVWCARFMTGRKERIEQDLPFIDFPFESLSAQL